MQLNHHIVLPSKAGKCGGSIAIGNLQLVCTVQVIGLSTNKLGMGRLDGRGMVKIGCFGFISILQASGGTRAKLGTLD
jgi:hypothetical protein